MDATDKQLLHLLSQGLAIQARPFDRLGSELGLDTAETLVRLQRLMVSGRVGCLRPVIASHRLGHTRVLAAAFVPEEKQQTAEAFCRRTRAVFSVFERKSRHMVASPELIPQERQKALLRLNFWFWIQTGPGQDIHEIIEHFYEETEAAEVVLLRAFDRTGSSSPFSLEGEALNCLRACQKNLPLIDEPYRGMARDAGMSQERFLQELRNLRDRGIVRRVAALGPGLGRARSVMGGVRTSVLWCVPEERMEKTLQRIENLEGIAGCRFFSTPEEFPFSLHIDFNTASENEVAYRIEEVERLIGAWPRMVFAAGRVYKKDVPVYFDAGEAAGTVPERFRGFHEVASDKQEVAVR